MDKDENGYNDSYFEFKRTFHRNTSNQAHDIMVCNCKPKTISKDSLYLI